MANSSAAARRPPPYSRQNGAQPQRRNHTAEQSRRHYNCLNYSISSCGFTVIPTTVEVEDESYFFEK
ncbi:hypothetical protein SUGI_1177420 [Cryptomeria japonica]|nr:hypothetical protein SUGI_1177420 [Cryptomeria japonica]